jgi:hypothetical protein
MTTIYSKPGLAMRIAASAAMAEENDRRRVKRKKPKRLSAAQRAFNKKHGIGTYYSSSGIPRKVLKAIRRAPTRKRTVTMPKLKFEGPQQ